MRQGHLYVSDKRASRIANDKEMADFQLLCKKTNPKDDGPQNPLEIFDESPKERENLRKRLNKLTKPTPKGQSATSKTPLS